MKQRIVVLGDVFLDRYVEVSVSRRAQEALIDVWDEERTYSRLGGAANVAANVASLAEGAVDVSLVGIVGPDRTICEELKRYGVDDSFCYHGHAIVKQRIVHDDRIIGRLDSHRRFSDIEIDFLASNVEFKAFDLEIDLLVVSDYDKGTVSHRIFDTLCKKSKKVIIDSKREDLSLFRGGHLLKLNEHEYAVQASSSRYSDLSFEALFSEVVVTRGAHGAELRIFERKGENSYAIHSEEFPTVKRHPVDVTGCGDTHTAAMAVSLVDSKDVRSAIRFANAASAKAVQSFGTTVVSPRGGLKELLGK